jgi:hypothetical protein
MKNLTIEQIECVINWMNTWEQLKDTAIPIRFKNDFIKQLGTSEKPPIGIIPEFIWKAQRRDELIYTIDRYMTAGMKVPKEWIIEFNKHCNE